MNIKNIIKIYRPIAIKFVLEFISNPNIYVAALIGGFIGSLIGGIIGAISGGFIGSGLQLLGNCITLPWGLDPTMSLGTILGLVIGVGAGAATIALLTIFKIYIKTRSLTTFSKETTHEILLSSLSFSIELATGMGIGAIIGGLESPGYGLIFGAILGLLVMLLIIFFKQRSTIR